MLLKFIFSDFSRREIISKYADYARAVETKIGKKVRPALIKPILQIFAGMG